jgi:hypothetical protein
MALPLMAIAAGAGVLGKLFGGAAKGQSQERGAQNDFTAQQNQQALSKYGIDQGARTSLSSLQENATMNRANLGIQAPQARMKQALLGSMLQNMQSAKVSAPSGIRMGSISGGLDPSTLLSAATRAGGGEMEKQALMALLSKSDVPGATDYVTSGKVEDPTMQNYKTAGKGESLLSALGLLGSVGGAISEIGNINKPKTPADSGPWA